MIIGPPPKFHGTWDILPFDEAHLLFADASKAFLQAVEQTVKLIRSKGVGVFFCTQLPTDVPDGVLSQLGARIQHALRAFTPNDQQALVKTVKTYPKTADYDLASALTSLGTGEAIVTVLSDRGAPTPVAWTRVRAPRSLMAPAPADSVSQHIAASPLNAKYGQPVDRESAYELLTARLADAATGSGDTTTPASAPADPAPAPLPEQKAEGGAGAFLGGLIASTAGKSFLRSLGSALGGALGRGTFGTRRRR